MSSYLIKGIVATLLLTIGGMICPNLLGLIPIFIGGYMVGNLAAEAEYRAE